MNVQETIEELIETGMEIAKSQSLELSINRKEELVLRHIKEFSKKEARITDFQPGLEWFNVAEGLSIYQHLKGKIVILDFFTYCCINCMHVLSDLDVLEKLFSIQDGLVIVGVHSAKFPNEKNSKKLLSAIQRYNIKHPVVNDTTMSMWHYLGIVCWPTLIMLGPTGELLAVFVGEGHRDELIIHVGVALTYFRSLNKIHTNDIPLQLAQHLLPVGNGNILFPSKVEILQTEQGENLVVADTGHNRILVMDTAGNVQHIIGGPNPDFRDGNFEIAKFNGPQGMSTLDSVIYVADTKNHAIRKIDLIKKTVITIAGTGTKGNDYNGGKIGTDQVLASPWDLAIYKHEHGNNITPILLIAMAGNHQIWALFLEDTIWWKNKKYKEGTCLAIVGSGTEENRNNTYPLLAGLAQPSGITIAEVLKIAVFADSESSAIRSLNLQTGQVVHICGGSRNPLDLHDYGDTDGVNYGVKLQHPLGIAWHPKENIIYITDTYNHKIKIINVSTKQCKAIYGVGIPHASFLFDEPSGIAINAEKGLIYIADTNNHAVKMINTERGNITTLPINIPVIEDDNNCKNIYFFDTTISETGGKLNVLFSINFSDRDLKLNPNAPQKWTVNLTTNGSGWTAMEHSGELTNPIVVTFLKGNETHEVRVILDIVACKTTECISKRLLIVYRVHQVADASTVVTEKRKVFVK
ncbi:NHL repeat-containing protein 2 [Bombus terrestris]|uniref:NHL repeat-containing protein 2 n=1 Tax=Bombus terrestris TaxID=30195 RepID=A0A9B2JPF2_BOMTE|nr:NHL repeat-containing protein 2 [Bombus terrestris]